MNKKRRRRLFTSVISVILVLSLCSAWILAYENYYAKVVYPDQIRTLGLAHRLFTTYEPFSGKLFQIKPSDTLAVWYRSSSGDAPRGRDPFENIESHKIEDWEIEKGIFEMLNSFRYYFWAPAHTRVYRQGGDGQGQGSISIDKSPETGITIFFKRIAF